MKRIGEIVNWAVHGKLYFRGENRTFARVPMWLAVIAGLSNFRFAVITALLVIGLGIQVHPERS